MGPILGRGFTEKVVQTVNSTQPELIAVVGDLVDGSMDDLRSAVEPISGRVTGRSCGNHEYFSGAEEWTEHVAELGLRLLANQRVELAAVDLACVNDMERHRSSGTASCPTGGSLGARSSNPTNGSSSARIPTEAARLGVVRAPALQVRLQVLRCRLAAVRHGWWATERVKCLNVPSRPVQPPR